MDVRCEKCGTEYELDETRLKPGGVTVKCTSCGHMFKIRKRSATNLGMPVPAASSTSLTPPIERLSRPSDGPGSSPGIPRPQTITGSGPSGDRSWIVRMANGEQRTCRELAALQQWIVSGLVKRDSMISRSGKTWKQLGDIPELAQFFSVADEALEVRTRRDSVRATSPQQAPGDKNATPEVKQTLLGVAAAADPAKRRPATQPPPPPKALAAHAGPMAPLAGAPANDSRPSPPRPPMPDPAKPAAPSLLSNPPGRPAPSVPPPALGGITGGGDGRSTGAWASEDVKPLAAPDEQGGASGPLGGAIRKNEDAGFGGSIRSVPTHDVAFGGSMKGSAAFNRPQPRESGGFENLAPSEMLDDDTGPVLQRGAGGGVGKWIAVGSLLLIAGAAAAIYFIVVRQSKSSAAVTDGGAEVLDAGAIAGGSDGGGPVAPDRPANDDAITAAREVLASDVTSSLDSTANELAEGTQDAARLAMRARLGTAAAQQLEDQALLAGDGKKADPLRKEARKRVAAAMTLAQKAVKTAPEGSDAEVLARVAMADVLRLQGKPVKDVKAHLGRALELAPKDREALLVSALLTIRDGKPADAKATLDGIESAATMEMSGDVRPRFRLAMLAFAGGDVPAAQQAAEDVLALQAEHPGAQALLARLRDAVVTTDPMPAEEEIDAGARVGSGSSGSSGGGGGGGSSAPSGDYDSLLGKADRLAEVNCAEAMPYYTKALELKPNGVAALTGRGYCYIDSKQFSSAHSSFRAALAVSRRYEPALWGIGEAYQQQGLKDKAIEAYQNYLEAYPGSAKAIKQIDKLGGGESGGGGEPSGGGGDTGGSGTGGGGDSGGGGGSDTGGGGEPSGGDTGGGDTGGGAGSDTPPSDG